VWWPAAARPRATVRKPSTNSETIVIGKPDTLVTRADGFSLSCRISAEDDYQLP
jgi:hypothetical protein